MENRYLFRGKRTDNNEWVYGLPSYDEDGEIEEIEVWSEDDINFYSVDPSTICQCTGLNDKNGNLIWENDIVNCMDAECCGYISWNESEAGFYFDVLLEDGRFEEEHIYDYQDCMEVIGNNFDNPELLEV